MRHELTITDSLVTPPAVPALTLAYVKQHIQAISSADDTLVAVWVEAADSYFQEQTGRQTITAVREAWLDAFPFVGATGRGARIQLPYPPLQAVLAVEYVAGDGSVQSFSDGASPETPYWTASAPRGPYAARGYVEPVSGMSWPSARDETGAVRIRYRCGYGDADTDVPELVRGILCYLVGHFDTFRAAVHEARRGQVLELPYGVADMLDGFKYSGYSAQVLRHQAHPRGGTAWR